MSALRSPSADQLQKRTGCGQLVSFTGTLHTRLASADMDRSIMVVSCRHPASNWKE